MWVDSRLLGSDALNSAEGKESKGNLKKQQKTAPLGKRSEKMKQNCLPLCAAKIPKAIPWSAR